MAQTAIAARRIQSVGSMTEFVAGVVSVGAAAVTSLTLPQFSLIQGVVVTGSTADEVVTVASISSGNVINFDNEGSSSTNTAFIAWGIGF